MISKKKVLGLFTFACACSVLVGCSTSKTLEGKWSVNIPQMDDPTITFQSDGTFNFIGESKKVGVRMEIPGTYTVSGDTVEFTFKDFKLEGALPAMARGYMADSIAKIKDTKGKAKMTWHSGSEVIFTPIISNAINPLLSRPLTLSRM